MNSQHTLRIEDVLRRKDALYGWRIEHITGVYDQISTELAKWDIWEGTLAEIAIAEYTGGILLAILVRNASRLVSLGVGSYKTEDTESCQFEICPFEFRAYEWDNGDISLQAGEHGLDDTFIFRAPKKRLCA